VQKLGQWYRRKYKRPEATKTVMAANPFTAVLAANIEKAPQKLSLFHKYFKMYWKLRIRDKYLCWFAVAKKEYDEASDDDKTTRTVKKPIPVQLRMEIGMEFWLLESEEFQAEVAQEAKKAHAMSHDGMVSIE
jgi:hypothetical protein